MPKHTRRKRKTRKRPKSKKVRMRKIKTALVYFIQADKFVKIGTTESLPHRLRALQTGSPVKLKVLGTIPGDRHVERLIHIKLKKFKYRAEWFNDSPEVRNVLAEHKKVPFLDQVFRKRCQGCGVFLAKRSKATRCKKC